MPIVHLHKQAVIVEGLFGLRDAGVGTVEARGSGHRRRRQLRVVAGTFWQGLILVLVVGGLTIGMIHAMKRPTR